MLDLRELERPLVGAPMAGGASTPALAAAVTDAGGLGFLAAGYRTAEQVAGQLEEAAGLTSGPVGVNLFVVAPFEPAPQALERYRTEVAPEAARLGVEPGEARWDDDDWQAKLDVVLDVRPAVVSFTFGCPDAPVFARLSAAGITTMVTVTTAEEAAVAAERGADALVVQGPEAGAHRGTWDPLADPGTTSLLPLVDAVRASSDLPLVAGGGLIGRDDVAAVLDRGAAAALVGTALLAADEAGTNPVHRAALQDPRFDRTILTRAFTGRWARGLANRFTREHAEAPAGYPHLHHLTAPIRSAAVAAGDPDVVHLWAGTGYGAARSAPAAEILADLTP